MKAARLSVPHMTLLASALAAATPGWAQAQFQTPAASLPEVRVDAAAEAETAATPVLGYRAKNAISATKTDTPLAETPQSVTIVPRDELVDRGVTNMQDALNYSAGVRSDAYGLDARTDSVRVRGGYPDVYLDGLRQNYGYYTSTTRTEPYTLERIEVLRGPAGMLFGSGTAAGIVNMVSKRPLLETQREVGVELGSYGRKQIQADLTGALTAWIEVGAPDAARLHSGSMQAARTVVYTHRDPAKVSAPWAGKRIHRADEILLHSFDPGFVEAAAALVERRNTMTLSVTERRIYLDLGGASLESDIHTQTVA